MSVRGSFATPLIACICLCWSVSAVRGAVSSRPSGAAATQPSFVVQIPATAPAETGVVRTALRRLGTIPRPGTELPDLPAPVPNGSSVRRTPSGSVSPTSPVVKPIKKSRPVVVAGQNGGPPSVPDQPQVVQPPVAQGQLAPGVNYVYPTPSPYVYIPPTYVDRGERNWNNYLYYRGQPGRYGYGWVDDFADDYWGDTYRFGFNRGYDYGRFISKSTEQQDAIIIHALDAMDRGLKLFKEGRYRQAIDAFKLAAETNQGDPAARIYAAHALFATGRYREAMPFLKRAFELQPKLAVLDYDMRGDYGRREDFESQVKALESALAQSPSSVERLIMLGYVRFYSGQKDAAFDPLTRASQIDPGNSIPGRLLPHCMPPDVVLDRSKAATRSPASTK